jgi:uncharacterized membrane protein YoaK (UPF0700 family)
LHRGIHLSGIRNDDIRECALLDRPALSNLIPMKITIPDTLTFNGGYVDTAGFLALQGLFTAHVTGNFVTLGASLAHGSSGILNKLLALPIFCLVVLAVRFASARPGRSVTTTLNTLIAIKVLLFAVAAVLAAWLGPFSNADSVAGIVTGMTLVAGMAIQNAIHRIFFSKAPPTTLMTGSTTQIMIDIADLIRGALPPQVRSATWTRCARLLRSVCIFALGCGVSALIYLRFGTAVFIAPPVVAALAFLPPLTRARELSATTI